MREGLTGYRKSASSQKLLGCSWQHLKVHLQSQFSRGMNWNNYGTIWVVDHILPIASFDLSDIEQQKRCFHFSNLRPLHKVRNNSKGAKIEERQPELTIDLLNSL